MKKIIYLEGMPGVGKSSLIEKIKKMKIPNVHVVEELIGDFTYEKQEDFFENDKLKLAKYNEGVIFIDRGPISTISYVQAKMIIDNEFKCDGICKSLSLLGNAYTANTSTIYLTGARKGYYLPYDNIKDPYGSFANQQLLESITLYNCEKYCEKFIIREINSDRMEEFINEIIN